MNDPPIPDKWRNALFTPGRIVCPVCKGTDWRPGRLLATGIVGADQLTIASGIHALMAQAVCVGCRHVLLFDIGTDDYEAEGNQAIV